MLGKGNEVVVRGRGMDRPNLVQSLDSLQEARRIYKSPDDVSTFGKQINREQTKTFPDYRVRD